LCEARVKLFYKLLAFPASATILLPAIVQADILERGNNSQEVAQASNSSDSTDTLKITVTGTRTERSVDEIPASISIIDLGGIRNSGSTSLEDVLRYEPGVNVFSPKNILYMNGFYDRGSTSRGNVNIRGMRASDQRILSKVGGVRLPAGFYGQGYDYSSGDYLDFNVLKTVDILKGSASSLYGADALGGVISYNYLEAEDIVKEGKNYGIEIPINLSGASSTKSSAIKWAGINEDIGLSAVAIYSYERSGELLPKDHDVVSTYLNEVDRKSNNYFFNIKKAINDTSTIGFVVDKVSRDTDTTLASGNYAFGQTAANQDVANDSDKFILSYSYESALKDNFVRSMDAKVYVQNTLTSDMWHEDRYGYQKRVSDYDLTDDTTGFDIQLGSNVNNHQLTYGLELSDTYNEFNQQKSFTNIFTGTTVNYEISRGSRTDYPIKRSPDSNTKRLGIYLQDEFSTGNLDVIAGLRYDNYKLEVDADRRFLDYCEAGGDPCPPIGELDIDNVSPNIALTYKINPKVSTYGKYSRGFRPASWQEMNGNQINLGASAPYQTKGNSEVDPEKSNSYEIGLIGDFKNNKIKLAAFYTSYTDFIGTKVTGYETVGAVDNVRTSQITNVSDANIKGLELSNEFFVSDNISILTSASYQEGEDETANEPLDHIDPFKAVTGFRYTTSDNKFVGELVATYLGQAEYKDSNTDYLPESSMTIDLLAKYKVNDSLDLDLGVTNLLDSSYYKYQNVRGIRASQADLKKFAEPGRSLNAGFKFKF
tara:strand:+ start:194 stop:2491 length:2298 start_codon:yes stop_codon:yes gene_type:complete